MCGIIGKLGQYPQTSDAFARSRDLLTHRGPDDAGIWNNVSGTVMLGHRRLSIIDLSDASHQPLSSVDGRCVIVFNGEVYNYLEIRRELMEKGHRFRSSGDTEVVLAAYEEWGYSCVEYFNGMFAFAIYDQGDSNFPEQLFVARDRVGKKPFYYRHMGRQFDFASELKAIDTADGMNIQALNHYLALGYVPFDLCISEKVKKLLPGHVGVFDIQTGSFRTWSYWQLPRYRRDDDVTLDNLANESWELLKKSVTLRLRSDVSTGVFLSGGLDSSLVVAAASETSSSSPKTFTISVPGSAMDESSHARLVADHFATDHHVLELPKPSLNVLDELAPFVDEPLADSSILPTFLVSRLTSEHVKVALGGDGGDELYGGYRHYQQPLVDMYRFGWVPEWLLGYAGRLSAKLPPGVHGRNRLASLRGGIAHSRVWGTPYFDIDLRRRILHPELVDALGDQFDLPERNLLRLMGHGEDVVDSLTRADFNSILPDDFLVKVDRASMANSLEVRNPFLDHRLVEHAFGSIPSSMKVNRVERRRIQNLMAKKYLPQDFELNRKQGFSIPMDEWLRKEDIFGRLVGLYEFVNEKELQKLVKGQNSGRANGSRLFALMMLAISHKNINVDREDFRWQ